MLEKFEILSVDQKTAVQGYHWTCEKPWAVLQLTHGMAEHLMRYEVLAKYLNERNIAVIGHDHLGHGASVSAPKGLQGYFHDEKIKHGLVQDLYQVTQWGKKQYSDIPFFLLGHSMGSFVVRNYLYEYGEAIDGAILVGTGQQPAWLSSLSEEVDAYLADPKCGFLFTLSAYHELFSLIIRSQEPELLQRVPKNLPLLFLSGKEDPVGEYGKGVMKAAKTYQAAGVKQVTVKLYENARHELLNEAQKLTVFHDICKWMEKNSGK
ncbi:alpha/beta fold hydrolase [Enterococcus avium]|uniref:alpha/beta fold hydrolase n=1 Tax=Enterococcus avium TaxID=33945 RepID=UPI0022E01A33|nr:alpha/beta fold hydrolase [Enterococcus avium]